MTVLASSLNESQQALLRQTATAALADLDEDALLDLHLRVRRTRDKYVGVYRREASATVADAGGRGKARPRNRRNYDRAEVFEDALARVSRRLATVARQNAAAIKRDRIAAVGDARNTQPPRAAAAPRPQARSRPVADRTPDTGALRRQRAGNQATGARRQAAKDNR